jgi:hypothetical protein
MGLLYGHAGRLTAENGGFRPGQFDGMCLFRPTGLNKEWATNGNSWFHTDRSPHPQIDERKYIQGLVNIVRSSPAGGGNVVVPRSHKLYRGLVEELGRGEGERRAMDVQRVRRERPEVFSPRAVRSLSADLNLNALIYSHNRVYR